MRSMEDKEVTSNGTTINFEFHKGSGSNRAASSHHQHHQHHPHRTPLGKPAPSKWDDAQKWLVGLSRGGHEKGISKNKPRNSNADDTRLIAPTPQQETDFSSTGEEEVEKAENVGSASSNSRVGYEVETKKVDCEESFWCVNKSILDTENGSSGVRSVCLRDMGTEMTPAASQEPSRTATPIRAATPVGPRSPITSGSTTPIRCQHAGQSVDDHEAGVLTIDPKASPLARGNAATTHPGVVGGVTVYNGSGQGIPDHVTENRNVEHAKKMNPLEMRAMAWDEAERAKYMARYKQEEVKIQAWENHQKRKAEMQMKKMEVKAERMKARAQEKYANKLASTRRIAEEKRGNAEAKLNEKAVRTSEKADYIRRTGHLPSSFSFKIPSFCCCW
ncbi:Remorin 4.1-like protein [Drosera capensis]